MRIIGSIIKEQGVTFAIVLVKRRAVQTSEEAATTRASFELYFPGLPLILATKDVRGNFEYQGRKDIVSFLAGISSARIPWREFHSNG
jgi:hypothetical protein